jgi:orotidine-5'-phosphate decarboxylase
MPGKPEIIVALDVPSAEAARIAVNSIGKTVSFYKVGLELFVAEGPTIIGFLKDAGKRVFLDLKLHDIPRTVARSITSCARHGCDMLTVHAGGGRDMLKAAAEAGAELGTRHPAIVAVTTLTSLNQNDLHEMSISMPLREHTLSLGEMAVSCGVDGLVCSAWEASDFRKRLGLRPLLVTPGIRPAGDAVGDQKRVATPAAAVRAGASYLVIGRPILDAPDPAAAAMTIAAEIAAATSAAGP